MCYAVSSDNRIIVRKSLFGLHATLIYKPTGSVVDARVLEFSSDDGEQLKRILSASGEEREKAIGAFRPKPVTNGNYLAEICVSRDGSFLAVQLLQFSMLKYEPVTDALIFEGDEARLVSKLFQG